MVLTKQSKSRDCLTGLMRYVSISARFNSSELHACPREVKATSRVPAMVGSALMARARVNPSIPGIWRSNRARS